MKKAKQFEIRKIARRVADSKGSGAPPAGHAVSGGDEAANSHQPSASPRAPAGSGGDDAANSLNTDKLSASGGTSAAHTAAAGASKAVDVQKLLQQMEAAKKADIEQLAKLAASKCGFPVQGDAATAAAPSDPWQVRCLNPAPADSRLNVQE